MMQLLEQLGVTDIQLAIASSACAGLCIGLLALCVLSIVHADRRDGTLGYIELRRRQQLREASSLYRNFEPVIVGWAAKFPPTSAASQAKARTFDAASQILPNFPPWKMGEYAAAALLKGVGVGFLAAAAATIAFGWAAGIGAFLVVPPCYAQAQGGSIRDRTRQRISQIKRRLPFAVDLMALTMESGASFLQALRTVVSESRDHPLGQELGKVVARIDQGDLQNVALEEFQARLNDDDVRQLIDAINQGEQLGTPLAQILRKQSDVMQLKTSQWVERAAKEAEVRMTGPGFVMAIACMIIVAAPFMLKAVDVF